MNQAKPKQACLVVGLYLVSLILFLIASFLQISPELVFSLTYQPLNVTTTALVDTDEFIVFSQLHQRIELPRFTRSRYQLNVITSGGMVVETLEDSGLNTLTLLVGEQSIAIEIVELIGQQQVTWQQAVEFSPIITMTNFVKINDNLLYGLYVQNIQVYKI